MIYAGMKLQGMMIIHCTGWEEHVDVLNFLESQLLKEKRGIALKENCGAALKGTCGTAQKGWHGLILL